jgi:hypothetical protein
VASCLHCAGRPWLLLLLLLLLFFCGRESSHHTCRCHAGVMTTPPCPSPHPSMKEGWKLPHCPKARFRARADAMARPAKPWEGGAVCSGAP